MREILFRGKRVDNGEWVFGVPAKDEHGEMVVIESIFECDECACRGAKCLYVEENTVGQYTGLTDKNGKKIFEGDICRVVYIDRRCDSNGKHYDSENAIIEEVSFKKGTFCFKNTIEYITLYRPIGFEIYEKQEIKYFEIIGNIHENSEILEVEE